MPKYQIEFNHGDSPPTRKELEREAMQEQFEQEAIRFVRENKKMEEVYDTYEHDMKVALPFAQYLGYYYTTVRTEEGYRHKKGGVFYTTDRVWEEYCQQERLLNMRWIKSNDRRPATEGFYFTEDSEGARLCTEFAENHWHSETNNPIAKWIDETIVDDDMEETIEALEDLVEAVPSQNDDCDWWSPELSKAMEKAKAIIQKY